MIVVMMVMMDEMMSMVETMGMKMRMMSMAVPIGLRISLLGPLNAIVFLTHCLSPFVLCYFILCLHIISDT
ncbi:hypothetical protein D3C77_550970 [compost metagenome]